MRVRVTLEYECEGHEESSLSAVRCEFIGRMAGVMKHVHGAGLGGRYSAKLIPETVIVEKITEREPNDE